MNDNDGTFSLEYVPHEYLFKSNEKQSNSKSGKGGFRALSKLVFQNSAFRTRRVFHEGAEILTLNTEKIVST